MIANRILFLTFLIVVNSFGVFGSADATTGASDAFDAKTISCIEILKITHADETDSDERPALAASSIATDSSDIRYQDRFGEGKLFKSVPFDGAAPDQKQDVEMMHDLVTYTKQNFWEEKKEEKSGVIKNTCMVRIKVMLEGGSNVEYHCGLYVSGFDNYQRGTIEDYLLHSGEKQQHKDLRDLSCRASLQSLVTVGDKLSVVGKFSGTIIPEGQSPVEVFMKNRHKYMHSLPYFSFGEISFFPSSWFLQAKIERRDTPDQSKDYSWLRKIIRDRLFDSRAKVPKTIKEPKTAEEHLQLVQAKREKEYTMDRVCIALFERLGPDTDVTNKFSCFRTDKKDTESGGLPYYFNDSEQVFLSFLQFAAKEEGDSLETIRIVTPKYVDDSKRNATSVSLNFYSFFDMCRFCRGTLSQVLDNGFLHAHLTELLKKERVSLGGETPIKIQAFGYDRNVNKGEK